jgi:hypothetical protein
MSLWQFAACVDGHNKANSPEEEIDPLSASDFDDMLSRHADWIQAGARTH